MERAAAERSAGARAECEALRGELAAAEAALEVARGAASARGADAAAAAGKLLELRCVPFSTWLL